jgi:hypothetical protein
MISQKNECILHFLNIAELNIALLVPEGDAIALRNAVVSLWQNADLRNKPGAASLEKSERDFSDIATAQCLSRIIDWLCF